MNRSIEFLRCTLIDGEAIHDIEIAAAPETTTASILATLPTDLRGRSVYCGTVPISLEGTFATSPITHGCVLTVGRGAEGQFNIPDDAIGVLNVLQGPDTGTWTWVSSVGPTTIGRDASSDLVLKAPDVSREHARLEPTQLEPAKVTIADVGSKNGTWVGEAEIREPTAVPDQGLFGICDNVIQWVPLKRSNQKWKRSPAGRIEIDRRYHAAPQSKPERVDLPPKVAERNRNVGQMVTALLTPVIMGLGMFVMTQNPMSLLMVLASPLAFFLQQYFEKKTHARKEHEYAQGKAEAATQIVKAVTGEELNRRFNDPDRLSLTLYAAGGLPGVWARQQGRPDALRFRVGVCDVDAELTLQGDRWQGLEQPKQRAVPVTVDLGDIGVLGVVGPRAASLGLLRWILIQLATRRSPDELRLYLISESDGRDLAWARWLPHIEVGDEADVPCRIAVTDPGREAIGKELANLVEARERQRVGHSGKLDFGEDIVVVLDGARELRKRSDLVTVLKRGPEVGVYTVCLDVIDINECKGKVIVEDDGRVHVFESQASGGESVTGEGMSAAEAEVVARLLAPLQDPSRSSGGASDIPYPVRFLDLLDCGTPTVDDVRRLWEDGPGPTTKVPLGADAVGTVCVDIAEQGPHTMLAGTTGAGKSVLLETLVISLLMHNRPDELNLVLVDFKGGSTFLPFVEFSGDSQERARREVQAGRSTRCPHVVGLILSTEGDEGSDFDEAAASRVIASLKAEVSRRERILSRYGGELKNYEKRKPANAEPLPRLLLVFDEFARVLDSAPGFMPQLVNVAGKGRSLGMHLLLATQSLTGKLTPELKNNVDLRISLRQNEKADSVEVLDAPDAASVPGRLKGRGYIVSKKDDSPRPKPFQSGHLVAPPPREGAPEATARIVAWEALGDARPLASQQHSAHAATDRDLALDAVEAASTAVTLPVPFRPLLPPLPTKIAATDLPGLATEPIPAGQIPFALADLPSMQAQPTFTFPLDGSMRLMIAGGSQSGRTTALRALLHAGVRSFSPDELHIYVVEREPGGLADYEELPHVGGVFGPAEPDRMRRFITWLGKETSRREAAQYTQTTKPPTVLSLIDGWEIIHDPLDNDSFETSLAKTLYDVIRSGPKVGVHVIVTCDWGPLTRKLGGQFDTRVLLPFPQADIVKGLVPSGTPIPAPIKGRALLAGDGRQMQIVDPAETAAQFKEAVSAVAEVYPPKRFASLPRRVAGDDIARPADVSPTWIALGLGGDDSGPIGVDLFNGPQALLVSGGPGSGRSTAAITLTRQLAAAGVGCVVLAPRKSPAVTALAGSRGVQVLTGTSFDDSTLRTTVEALGTAKTAIIVDDAEQITVNAREVSFSVQPTLLRDACSAASFGSLGLILCGSGHHLMQGGRSLGTEARYAREEGTLVLIGQTTRPTLRDQGVDLEPDEMAIQATGRGHVWLGARRVPLQVADLLSDIASPSSGGKLVRRA